jgi:ubiquinone/menaquinone biosynthesis C-methylase UbiE
MINSDDPILDFWNTRASLGDKAGTNDVVLKELEMHCLASHLDDGLNVIEIGCGNGLTALDLAKRYSVAIDAYDFSPEMIAAAVELQKLNALKGSVNFDVGDVRALKARHHSYDLAYSERVLINLPDWDSQAAAIAAVVRCLKKGGRYLMLENSQDGLDAINRMRLAIGLEKIDPPWHNRYLQEMEINALQIEGAKLKKVEAIGSTYYFISRVINAWQAKQKNETPCYDAPINQLSLLLPPIGDFGQTKLWVWERIA